MFDHVHGSDGRERIIRLRTQVIQRIGFHHLITAFAGSLEHATVRIHAATVIPMLGEYFQPLTPTTTQVDNHALFPTPDTGARKRSQIMSSALLDLLTVTAERMFERSEERRVGKVCRARWTPERS